MEASWSPCLSRQGRWDLLFVQIREPPQPCPAHKMCVMKAGRAGCTEQLPAAAWSSLLQSCSMTEPLWGEALPGSCHSHAAKLPILCLWPGTPLGFIHPYPHPSHSPRTHGLSLHLEPLELSQECGRGPGAERGWPHPRPSTAFLGDTGGAGNPCPVSATAPAGSSTIFISWLAAFK